MHSDFGAAETKKKKKKKGEIPLLLTHRVNLLCLHKPWNEKDSLWTSRHSFNGGRRIACVIVQITLSKHLAYSKRPRGAASRTMGKNQERPFSLITLQSLPLPQLFLRKAVMEALHKSEWNWTQICFCFFLTHPNYPPYRLLAAHFELCKYIEKLLRLMLLPFQAALAQRTETPTW